MRTHIPRFLLLLLFIGALCVGLKDKSPLLGINIVESSLALASTSASPTENPTDAVPHHGDPYARVFLGLAILLICAVAGHFAARKLDQSAVLGELAVGILAGALFYQLSAPTITILRHADQVAAAVLASYFMAPQPLNLVFHRSLLGSVFLTVFIGAMVAGDGKANWLKGVS